MPLALGIRFESVCRLESSYMARFTISMLKYRGSFCGIFRGFTLRRIIDGGALKSLVSRVLAHLQRRKLQSEGEGENQY